MPPFTVKTLLQTLRNPVLLFLFNVYMSYVIDFIFLTPADFDLNENYGMLFKYSFLGHCFLSACGHRSSFS